MAPTTRRPKDPIAAAEAMFKKSAPTIVTAPPRKGSTIPAAQESVTLKIDRDVLEKFQEDGPGWQARINAALRATAGLDQNEASGKKPDELNATNDD